MRTKIVGSISTKKEALEIEHIAKNFIYMKHIRKIGKQVYIDNLENQMIAQAEYENQYCNNGRNGIIS